MSGMVGNLEKAVAAKMAGPATAPKGWTQGKKTGWKGGTVPPGLARVRAGLQGKPKPRTEDDRTNPHTSRPFSDENAPTKYVREGAYPGGKNRVGGRPGRKAI